MAGQGVHAVFLPAPSPSSWGREAARGAPRWESSNPAAPSAPLVAPGFRNLLPSTAMPNVLGIVRRWHLPAGVGNASWIPSLSRSPQLSLGKQFSHRRSQRNLWESLLKWQVSACLESHCGTCCRGQERPRVWRPGDGYLRGECVFSYTFFSSPQDSSTLELLKKTPMNYKVTAISSCGPNKMEQGRMQRGMGHKHVCALW